MLPTELEDKIAAARKVDIYYSTPHEVKYAVVRYTCRQGKPFKVASYYIYGEELKSGKPLICWHWLPSTNFCYSRRRIRLRRRCCAQIKRA